MLSLKLAVRFLKSGKGQTILIVIGIGIAIAAQIFIGLLITSLQKTLVNRTLGNQPQVEISSATDSPLIQNYAPLVASINQSALTTTVSVSASGNAFIQKGAKVSPILVRGLDTRAEEIYGLLNNIYQGDKAIPQNGLLIGKDLQEQYNYQIGDILTVTLPSGGGVAFPIKGFFDLGVAQVNQTWVITGLSSAQTLFGYGDKITSIEMKVPVLFSADIVSAQIRNLLNNPDLKVTDWKAQNASLLSGLQGQSISSLMIQIFIVVSVVIAIASILAITVFQKSRQLGILKAMGIKDRQASLIFIYEGLIIGVIGSIIGVALGLLLLYGFSIGTTKPGSQALIDLYIDYKFILLSWGIAVASAVLAALIPARRSLRLNPIDVIREG
jgi:lipoprotein-releasing system permease protein